MKYSGMPAALNAADRNPYSWNMEYLPYEDGSGYEARFSKCGIRTLMKECGLFELVPAKMSKVRLKQLLTDGKITKQQYAKAEAEHFMDVKRLRKEVQKEARE